MHTQHDPSRPSLSDRQPPVRTTTGGGGLSITKIVVIAGVLLALAYFLGKRPSRTSPVDAGAAASSAADSTVAPSGAGHAAAVVLQGEKSTTLTTVEEAHMSVETNGQVLRIEGGVGMNFARDLQAVLAAYPSLQRIDITSGGGYAGPGLEAARMINKRNLIVRVQSHCASMCVALWAAAAQRQLEPDALIGLHQWNAQCDVRPSPERERCNYQVRFATDHDSSYSAWLRSAGFNQQLLDLKSRTASEDIAILAAPQLWDHGVDFSVVDRSGQRMQREQVKRYLADKSQHQASSR